MFWVISRVSFALYRRFPVFGVLRASLGIIQQGDRYLVIRRNDGRGLSLPGGLATPWEPKENTLNREIAEETGLRVTAFKLVLQYYSDLFVPCNIAVFRVSATGQVRGSWEGDPEWLAISELRFHIVASQRPAIEWILSSVDDRNCQAESCSGGAAAPASTR